METSSSADETKDAHTNEDSSLGKSVVVLVCLAVKSKERKKYKKKKEQQKKKRKKEKNEDHRCAIAGNCFSAGVK